MVWWDINPYIWGPVREICLLLDIDECVDQIQSEMRCLVCGSRNLMWERGVGVSLDVVLVFVETRVLDQ